MPSRGFWAGRVALSHCGIYLLFRAMMSVTESNERSADPMIETVTKPIWGAKGGAGLRNATTWTIFRILQRKKAENTTRVKS